MSAPAETGTAGRPAESRAVSSGPKPFSVVTAPHATARTGTPISKDVTMPDADIALATQPVKWGVLSTAMIATTRTMPAMAQSPSSRLLAIASRRREQAERVARALGVPRVHGSYDELLADPDVDAVYVPLPNDLHVTWAARAMEAGKDVLCEKPLCLRADDVTALCAVRDRTGRHIEEAFGFRNHPQ